MKDAAGTYPSQALLLGFIPELEKHILPIYAEHERRFDYTSLHGRMHICRAVLFAEVMGCYCISRGLKPNMYAVRTAVAFHDSGRQDNGKDYWENDSAAMCRQYLLDTSPLRQAFQQEPGLADFTAGLIPHGEITSLEMQIVHDADVLEIMRLFHLDDWQTRFRPGELMFRGPRDRSLPAEPDAESTRSRLILEAWELIQLTDNRHTEFSRAESYFNALFNVFTGKKDRFPLLAGWIL